MDTQKRIDQLCKSLDAQTKELYADTPGKLLLLGQKDSIFLKAIKRKADSMGLVCDFGRVSPPYTGVVADTEFSGTKGYPLTSDVDIDNIKAPGISCVALGILYLLLRQGLVVGKTITIVGRGHAVKGLAQALIENDATVTVAHSKTADLFRATKDRDVVIYATPELTQYPCFNTKDLVIDLGNCFTEMDKEHFRCDFVGNIGRLTVSVILNEFAKNGRRVRYI